MAATGVCITVGLLCCMGANRGVLTLLRKEAVARAASAVATAAGWLGQALVALARAGTAGQGLHIDF